MRRKGDIAHPRTPPLSYPPRPRFDTDLTLDAALIRHRGIRVSNNYALVPAIVMGAQHSSGFTSPSDCVDKIDRLGGPLPSTDGA
eukprot:2625614-Rhodomonas_salina.3